MSRTKIVRGRDELERYVRALSCNTTNQLGRVLAIPDRTRLKKKQLEQRIVAYFLRVPDDPMLRLECPKAFGRSCSEQEFQKAFATRVTERYEGERKYQTDRYQGTALGPDGKKEGDLFAKCEVKSGAVVFIHELDTYAFQVNGHVKLLVAALERVEVKPGVAASTSSKPREAERESAPKPSVSTTATGTAGATAPATARKIESKTGRAESSSRLPTAPAPLVARGHLKPGLGGGEPTETEKSLVSNDAAKEVARVLDGVWNAALNWNREEARGVPDVEEEPPEGETREASAARLRRTRAAEVAANPNVERVQLVVDANAVLEVELRNNDTGAIVKLEPIRMPGTYGLRLFYQRLAHEFEIAATRALLPEREWKQWLRHEFGPARPGEDEEEEEEETTRYLSGLGGLGSRERKVPLPTVPSVAITALADRDLFGVAVEDHTLRWRGALACYVGEPSQRATEWSRWYDDLPDPLRIEVLKGATGRVSFTRAGSNGSRRLRFSVDSARNPAFDIALLPGGFFDAPQPTPTGRRSTRPTGGARARGEAKAVGVTATATAQEDREKEEEEANEEEEDEEEDDARDRELVPPKQKTAREEERKRKASLVQSAVALGMDWEAGPSIRVGESYVLPHPMSASLYARPTFGLGAHDCPPGWLRQPGYTGCCVYVISNALRTIDAKKLGACLEGECTGLEERDAAELKNYVRGVEEAQNSLQSYVGGLKLTTQQLQWTMTMAANVKEAWLRQLTQQMNDMLEDAGMSIHDEDCNTEALAGEVVVPPSASAAKEEKKRGRAGRLFFWASGGVLSAAYAVAKATGNGLVWALGWLWRFAKSTLVASKNIVTGVATKGMHLAAWILSDPRRARFILVLVRRMRITLCKRVGLYLMENGYARQFMTRDSTAHLDRLKDQSVAAAWATDVGEDVVGLAKQELSVSNLTASLYSGSAGQKVVGAAGKILAKGLQGALMSVPFVGGFLAGAGEVVGDLVGDSANNAMKQALEVQRVNSEIGNTLELLRDIFDLNGALRDAGFAFQVDYEKLFTALANKLTGVAEYVAPILRDVGDRLAPAGSGAAKTGEKRRSPSKPKL